MMYMHISYVIILSYVRKGFYVGTSITKVQKLITEQN